MTGFTPIASAAAIRNRFFKMTILTGAREPERTESYSISAGPPIPWWPILLRRTKVARRTFVPGRCCNIFALYIGSIKNKAWSGRDMRHRAWTAILLGGLCLATAQSAVSAAVQEPYLAGLRRLTESQYRNSIAEVFGPDILVQGRFEPDRRVGGLLAASTTLLSITPSG